MIIILKFRVNKQLLSRIDSDPIISGSKNYLNAVFYFSSDWNGYEKVAKVIKGNKAYEFNIENDIIPPTASLNLTEGKWEISVVGLKDVGLETESKITTSKVVLFVEKTNGLEGECEPIQPINYVVLLNNGSGNCFLSDDGSYKSFTPYNGKDGFSPLIKLSKDSIKGITTITTIDIDGTQKVEILDGNNKQADWNETDPASKSFILNKPKLFSGSYTDLENLPEIPNYRAGENIEISETGLINCIIPDKCLNIQADWNQTDMTKYDYILNKPDIPTNTEILNKFTVNENGDLYYESINLSNYAEHEIWVGTTEELEALTEDEKSYYKLFITTDNQDVFNVNVDKEVIEGSENPVSSNAVFTSIAQAKEEISISLTEINTSLDNKVDKEIGRGLSTNDFSDEYKNRLDSLKNPMQLIGRRENFEDLPTNPNNGDTYFVGEEPNLILWTYTEEGWASRDGSSIDLTGYLQIKQDDTKIGKYLKVGASGNIEFVDLKIDSSGEASEGKGITVDDLSSLGVMFKEDYDTNNSGMVDKAEVANSLLDAENALPNQVYMVNPLTNKAEFCYLPIDQNSTTPIQPMQFTSLIKDVPELIELTGYTTSIMIQVSEEIAGEQIDNEILDSFTSVNGMIKSDNIVISSSDGIKIKDEYNISTYILDDNGFKEYDLSEFINIKSAEMEVV